jgi:SAM-dependent methyltransferase
MRLERRECPICQAPTARVLHSAARVDEARFAAETFASRKTPDRMHFRFMRCTACDLLFADPAPDPEWLARAYEGAAFSTRVEAGFAARTYARVLERVFDRLPARGAALDIGTGEGSFLGELDNAGFSDVSGIEPSWAAIAQAAPEVRSRIRHGTFGPGSVGGGTHALVTCFQTLEHVPRPAELVATAAAALVPGGAFATVTHNYRAISARVLGESSPIFDVEHLQLFSPRSVRALLERAGLTAVEVRPIVNRYPLAYWARLLPVPPTIKTSVLEVLARLGADELAVPLPVGNLLAVGFCASR